MIRIHFPDRQTESRGLGILAGRFSFKSFEDGTTLVPEAALGYLATRGIQFTVEGAAAYGEVVPTVRDSTPDKVQ
jgi:hypothetical protein